MVEPMIEALLQEELPEAVTLTKVLVITTIQEIQEFEEIIRLGPIDLTHQERVQILDQQLEVEVVNLR